MNFNYYFCTTQAKKLAQMAELVDALDSKSGFRKGVQVRFLFWAHSPDLKKVTIQS